MNQFEPISGPVRNEVAVVHRYVHRASTASTILPENCMEPDFPLFALRSQTAGLKYIDPWHDESDHGRPDEYLGHFVGG